MKEKVKYFYKKKVHFLMQSEEFNRAELLLKNYLKRRDISAVDKSKIYELLGVLKFQTGNYKLSKRYYNLALKYNVKNSNALLNFGNILIIENRYYDAIKLLKNYLKYQKYKKEVLRQLGSCYAFVGDIAHARFIFEKILKETDLDEQSFVDYAYGYVVNKDFKSAKKIIIKALSKYPDSFVLLDAYDEFTDIEENMRDIKKNILFPFLQSIDNKLYLRAATILTEGMCIRGYFRFEIEKGLELLGSLHKEKAVFSNSNLLAAVCEYFTTLSIADTDFTLNTVATFYNINKNTLKKAVDMVNANYKDIIEEFTSELNMFYNYELDKIADELEDFDD
ncbi:hypothetical protein FHQ18_06410 [Deferribacter autotrophicus]|uniref:Uncharacterized protein n=1 Tax=Deferribacter autotrophicus TaxID=500465 RepID=A0A5A8F2J3_9BACT|nr:hypothetical protein [Deferribacter autotrophicus]KAA0258023.1 hypothetical protein FHQ18_06410 [Deferribacter autotrophicus]